MEIDVCLSPEDIHLYDQKGRITVVADIFRATSTMMAALNNGIRSVIPVSNLEECRNLNGADDIIKAAERGGKKVEGFAYGNSPFDYIDQGLSDVDLIMTTTNGTRAINLSKESDEVLIGAFLNLKSTIAYLKHRDKPVLVFCAGWKGKFSMEDTLYAGALVDAFFNEDINSDSALMAYHLYNVAREQGLEKFLKTANHYRRLFGFHNQKDIEFILSEDIYDNIGRFNGEAIVLE